MRQGQKAATTVAVLEVTVDRVVREEVVRLAPGADVIPCGTGLNDGGLLPGYNSLHGRLLSNWLPLCDRLLGRRTGQAIFHLFPD